MRVELRSLQTGADGHAGDRELLFRALENVVRNAVSYSPQGSALELSCPAGRATKVIIQRA